MKKVGILTLNGYHNYGNRLQNYATQEIIKLLGYEVDTILVKNRTDDDVRITVKMRYDSFKKKSFLEKLSRIENKLWIIIHKKQIALLNNNRINIFKEFSKKFISETDYSIYDGNYHNEYISKYDFFVVGSDQVWNPYIKSSTEIYFLTFVPKLKRIAFSPSFGLSHIPLDKQENFKKWINGIKYLSVREDAGAKIIKELTGRNAEILVDPTMLLSKDKWLEISKKPGNITNKKYVLTYFLGNITSEYKRRIRNIAQVNNLNVINLANIRDAYVYQAGPSEFIQYINCASVICTDSFHGLVFSLLMKTPVIVFERKGSDGISEAMYSRVETFLKKFHLESRKEKNIKSNVDIFKCDYSEAFSILEVERIKSMNYLRKALNSMGEKNDEI